jgi:hypothetical protein
MIEFQDNYKSNSYQDASEDLSFITVAIPYTSGSGTTIANTFETILDSYITTSNTGFAAINQA